MKTVVVSFHGSGGPTGGRLLRRYQKPFLSTRSCVWPIFSCYRPAPKRFRMWCSRRWLRGSLLSPQTSGAWRSSSKKALRGSSFLMMTRLLCNGESASCCSTSTRPRHLERGEERSWRKAFRSTGCAENARNSSRRCFADAIDRRAWPCGRGWRPRAPAWSFSEHDRGRMADRTRGGRAPRKTLRSAARGRVPKSVPSRRLGPAAPRSFSAPYRP